MERRSTRAQGSKGAPGGGGRPPHPQVGAYSVPGSRTSQPLSPRSSPAQPGPGNEGEISLHSPSKWAHGLLAYKETAFWGPRLRIYSPELCQGLRAPLNTMVTLADANFGAGGGWKGLLSWGVVCEGHTIQHSAALLVGTQ